MLVDLARNDLGRVCDPGTVEVVEGARGRALLAHHAPRLAGRGPAARGRGRVLAARGDVPRGHGLGRAEGARDAAHLRDRGHAAAASTPGAIGYVGYDGAVDTCIALRTIVMRDGVALLQAGAGIVADSVPAVEHQECLNKIARARRRDRRRRDGPVRAMSGIRAGGPRRSDPPARSCCSSTTTTASPTTSRTSSARQGADVDVRRHDAVDEEEAEALAPTHLVISPGPGRPYEAGVSGALIRRFAGRIPVLGVCLGHQCLVEAYGGRVDRATRLMHGKVGSVRQIARRPAARRAARSRSRPGRYHSLAALPPLPDDARGDGASTPTARSWPCATASSRTCTACSSTPSRS